MRLGWVVLVYKSPSEQWGTEQNVSVALGYIRGEGWQMLRFLWKTGLSRWGAVPTTVGAVACALLALGISISLLCGLKQTYLGSEGDHYFLLMWKTR